MRISQNLDLRICYIRMPLKSKNDCCAERSILPLPSAYQECPVTFKLMTSQVVQRAGPLTGHIWPLKRQRINYYSETWHFCNKTSADKLEMVNKWALPFVCKDKSSPYEETCKRIGLSSFRGQRLANIWSTAFKILASDEGPTSLRDLITVRCSTYNLRGTTVLDFLKVKSTTFGLRSWNAIPDESRKIQTYATFKTT